MPVYDPVNFYQLCKSVNAGNIFDFVLSSISSARHSKERIELNKKRAVAFLYEFCFCLSQKCDILQRDNGLFMKFCHMTDEGIDTQRAIGSSLCSRSVKRQIAEFSSTSGHLFESVVKDAINNEYLVTLMIDDWTKVYTKKRPTDERTSVADNFCTIIIKVTKEIKAIPLSETQKIHNPVGIDVDCLTSFVFSEPFFEKLSNSFVSTLPELSVLYFDPLMERHSLEDHDYHASTTVRSMRSFSDVHLLDFVKLPLKSRENYETALGLVLQSHLKEYLSRFVVLLPGDWPSQFFPRQIVYRACSSGGEGTPLNPITSLVPCMGPLHVDLNADEDIVTNFLPFLRFVYQSIFPGKKLADKPKPWRTQFLLEVTYGGWTLVRNAIRTVFYQCKDLQYGTLLNLLDNYIPLTLAAYNILFKWNRLDDYFYAVFRLWVMFFCFRRRHYNKSPLIWLSNILFWKNGGGNRGIYDVFSTNLNVIDEYFVEHVHSVIRRQTKVSDSDEQVQEKVHGIFASSERQANWRSIFTPTKNSVFSRQQLTSLYCKAATVITNVCLQIASNPHAATIQPRQPGQRKDCSLWLLPNLFGEKSIKSYILPLGYNFHETPDPRKRCDSPSCNVSSDLPWKLFEGCWHSFHLVCLRGSNICVICRDGLKKNMKSLAKTANDAFVTGVPILPAEECEEHADVGDEAVDADDQHEIPEVGEVNVDQIIQELTRQIFNTQVQQPSPNSSTTVLHVHGHNSQANQPASRRRPRHCSTCHHNLHGHQHQTSEMPCSYCPDLICCRGGGGVICSCQWCVQHSAYSSGISSSSLSSEETRHQPTGPTVVSQNQRGDVTEWVVSVSQSSVAGQSGSNACTIIAVLIAVNFLLPTGWVLPCSRRGLPQPFVGMFKELMVQGNIVHQWLGHSQQNYSAPEVIQHPGLGFSGVARCGDEFQFTSFQQFAVELTTIVNTSRTKLAAVLILPPDKSMVLLIGEMGQLVLLESHQHLGAGGIVASAGPHKIKEMVLYIEEMAKRDWGGNPVPFDVSFVQLI